MSRNSRSNQTYLSYSHTFASTFNIGVSGDSSLESDTASEAEENVEEEIMENILTISKYFSVDIEKLKVLFQRSKICGNAANIKKELLQNVL